MKKVLAAILSLALVFSLAACGSSNTGSDAPSSREPTNTVTDENTSGIGAESETPAPESEEPSSAPAATDEPESGKILVAYFSWSGNTEELAGMIQQETGGDLFEIEPATPYTDDYNALLDQAQQEQREDARPELAAAVENWDAYDVIFVGYPNWWGDAPMLILSFLEAHDCAGKTIVPFCTSGGGGFGSSISSITDSAAGATILDGFHVGGSSVSGAGSDVAAWIDGLGVVQ